jgi:5-(hydroxymethyl)furfural/furfural oxidase
MLVEAGPDFASGAEPADVASVYPLSYFNPRYLWRSMAASPRERRAAVPFPQGRLVGGSSAVMGMWAVRGFPDDYDEWQSAGAAGWAWDDVLPFFVRAERDLDFGGSMHGGAGPVSIRRQRKADWPPYCRAVACAAESLGLEHVADMNAEFRDGISVLPISATDRRVSAASAYLTHEVRARSNLRIASDVQCVRVVFDGVRAIGIEAQQGRSLRTFRASEVIVSAGALQSPTLLMRSGVGPQQVLERHGLNTVSARPGVGENLQNHAMVALGAHLAPASMQPDMKGSAAFFCLRMSSAPDERSDLYFSALNRSSWHYFGRKMATLVVMLHKPHSRGRVGMTSTQPGSAPKVDFAFLSDQRDAQRLVVGLRSAVRLLGDERVQQLVGRSGLVRPGRLTRMLAHRTPMARVLDHLCSTLFPLAPFLEDRLFGQVLGDMPLASLSAATDELLHAQLRQSVSGVFHPVGTCRMGRHDDPGAVVDPAGRVHGTHGLRVIDASIMPAIPRAGTFLPTVMIAEKIGAAIVAGTD